MKRLLLDHNVDPRIARHLTGCEIRRAAQEGLTDVSNGDLIRAAQLLGFDALLTKDRNMEYQQSARPAIAVLVARCGNPFAELLALAPDIAEMLKGDLERRFYSIESKVGASETAPRTTYRSEVR